MGSTTTVNHQLVEQLKDVGDKLLQPPSSTPEFLNLLDEAVLLLSKVGQAPSHLVHEALLSMMKALISDNLMRNSDADIMITVAACLNEILRISAPVAPYDDEKMKEIFELIVLSFDKLSCPPGRCYSKAVLILESVARLRSCVMMLDLDCDSLVTKMFELFQKHISSNHPQSVILAMEKIMCVMIIESDSLPVELLNVLLGSIRKENENKSPAVFKLGTKVVKECSEKLQPYIIEAVTSAGCCLDDYAPILSSICETEPIALEDLDHDSAKHMPLKTIGPCSQNPRTDSETASKKRENMEKKSPESPRVHVEKVSVAPRTKKGVPMMVDEPSKSKTEEATALNKKKVYQASSVGRSSDKKGNPPKKNVSGGSRKKSTTGSTRKDRIQTNDAVKSQRKRDSSDDDVFETPHGKKNYKEDLVGCRIKVWWPLDRCHYEGSISSYDASTKKHKVDYDDGDQEVLNLRTEQWEFVGDEISTDIALLLDKKSTQQRLKKPKREASTVFEKENSRNKSNKREVMHDIGNGATDGSHQATKSVEKVKTPENLSETTMIV